jgi:Bacterial archaeo-eukaryotic release factor family 10/eRF1 domain 3
MIPDPDLLNPPSQEAPAELLEWRPKHGVISLYISIDPGDRSNGWRTAVRNGLSEAAGGENGAADHETRLALRETAARLEHVLEEERKGEHRGLLGFVEVSRHEGEERWYATQIPPRRTEVLLGPVPRLRPLLALLDDGAPIGVAVVSSERVRLFDWRLGQAEQLHDWELEYFGEDWRERKAQRPRDPAHGEAVSASGRDQYEQRMEDTRERFADQTGGLARAEARKHGWRRTLVFGDERYASKFAAGFGDGPDLAHVEESDLIGEPAARIERRVEELLPGLNRARETSLIDRIKEAAYAEGRSSLGVQETLQALEEGRVEHLVYDARRDYSEIEHELGREPGSDGLPLIERMVELALSTGAEITPVEGESAEGLAEQGGVAALLRY